jgi:hypothetical protein
LKQQIEECCPPSEPEVPPCKYAPCPAPGPIGDPPRIDDVIERPRPATRATR